MWKIFCFVALTSIATITAGNVVLGGLIDPELPVPFSLSLVNKCAKIAREVVHSASNVFHRYFRRFFLSKINFRSRSNMDIDDCREKAVERISNFD